MRGIEGEKLRSHDVQRRRLATFSWQDWRAPVRVTAPTVLDRPRARERPRGTPLGPVQLSAAEGEPAWVRFRQPGETPLEAREVDVADGVCMAGVISKKMGIPKSSDGCELRPGKPYLVCVLQTTSLTSNRLNFCNSFLLKRGKDRVLSEF